MSFIIFVGAILAVAGIVLVLDNSKQLPNKKKEEIKDIKDIDDVFFETAINEKRKIADEQKLMAKQQEEYKLAKEQLLNDFKDKHFKEAFIYLAKRLASIDIVQQKEIILYSTNISIGRDDWELFVYEFTKFLNKKNIKIVIKELSNIEQKLLLDRKSRNNIAVINYIYIDTVSLWQYFNKLEQERATKISTIITSPYR